MLMKTCLFASADCRGLWIFHSKRFVPWQSNYRTVNNRNRLRQLHLVAKLVVKIHTRQKQILNKIRLLWYLTNYGWVWIHPNVITLFAIYASNNSISPSSVMQHWSCLPTWEGTISVLITSCPLRSIPANMAHVSSFWEVLAWEIFRKSATMSIGQMTVFIPVWLLELFCKVGGNYGLNGTGVLAGSFIVGYVKFWLRGLLNAGVYGYGNRGSAGG